MEQVAFIGFGDLGKQVLSLYRSLYDAPDKMIVFDDIAASEPSVGGFTAKPFDQYKDQTYKPYRFFVCLGYKHLSLKNKIIADLISSGYDLPSLLHSSSYIHPSAKIGKAVYIYPMCNVDSNVSLADGVLLNNSVTVSHDTYIGASCYLSPGVTTAGFVKIGSNVFFGAGTVIANGLTIGDNCIIGMGTAVTKPIPDGGFAIGNPIRILSKPIKLT